MNKEFLIEFFKDFKEVVFTHGEFVEDCCHVCSDGFCIWDKIKIKASDIVNEEEFYSYEDQVNKYLNITNKTFCINQVIKTCYILKISPYYASTLILYDGNKGSFKACPMFKNCVAIINRVINLSNNKIEALELE